MSAAFTPGPWATSKGHPRRVTRQGKIICTAVLINGPGSAKSCDEAEANAHLIAAAPELYLALYRLLAAHGDYIDELPGASGVTDLAIARRALAKAKGAA